MGKSTVAHIVSEMAAVIWKVLKDEHMKTPTADDFKHISSDFEKLWNFPHCIGALDGKHIRINAPEHSGSQFFNYKHFFSIVLQALVDANYRFISIDVGGYGKQSDGGTFKASLLHKKMCNHTLNLPNDEPFPGKRYCMPYVMIADEAYPLMRNLLIPYLTVDKI
ncbi:uncharacterized protein LOC113469221 [Diaphorina citri]|jgi:hypothetical protein|uniref:Uncharacterized protein LOC113469221 n=1 Tax=Diaphorina citri TaxID=121845 RepID=A0A3Q0J224_DIACI|nr:uncharacterized protein LOC113469221 [Diaphorina citri]